MDTACQKTATLRLDNEKFFLGILLPPEFKIHGMGRTVPLRNGTVSITMRVFLLDGVDSGISNTKFCGSQPRDIELGCSFKS